MDVQHGEKPTPSAIRAMWCWAKCLDVTTLLTLRGQHGDSPVAHYSDDKPLAAGEELSVIADILVTADRRHALARPATHPGHCV